MHEAPRISDSQAMSQSEFEHETASFSMSFMVVNRLELKPCEPLRFLGLALSVSDFQLSQDLTFLSIFSLQFKKSEYFATKKVRSAENFATYCFTGYPDNALMLLQVETTFLLSKRHTFINLHNVWEKNVWLDYLLEIWAYNCIRQSDAPYLPFNPLSRKNATW